MQALVTPPASHQIAQTRGSTNDVLTGATPDAMRAYERALAAMLRWGTGVDAAIDDALRIAPPFVMARVLRCWRLLGTRDRMAIDAAVETLACTSRLPGTPRERQHQRALAAVLADDTDRATRILTSILACDARDLVALSALHSIEHFTGAVVELDRRSRLLMPALSDGLPGAHAVFAMHASTLESAGEYAAAERHARRALALEPRDVRAHHVLAHVFEMTERFDEGVRFMRGTLGAWETGSTATTHCWWHLALLHLGRGEVASAFAIYDASIRPAKGASINDLVDASSLLWRLRLLGIDDPARWAPVAEAWRPHVGDAFSSFNDLHAMLAFAGARDRASARMLLERLADAGQRPSRHGASTRSLGLPAARAVDAFARADHELAVRILADIAPRARGFGGSKAQRDVLYLTLFAALQSLRRSTRVQFS